LDTTTKKRQKHAQFGWHEGMIHVNSEHKHFIKQPYSEQREAVSWFRTSELDEEGESKWKNKSKKMFLS